MSRENVDIVRRGYEAFARWDFDAALELMHEDVEAHDPPDWPDATVYRGREAVKRDWEQTLEVLEDFSIDVEASFDVGDEVVLFLRYRGRGRESGAEVETPMAHIWTLRDGRAIRLRQYFDRAQALEAPGLPKQEAHADS